MTLTTHEQDNVDQADMLESLERAQAALRILPTDLSELRHFLAGQGVRGRVGDGGPCALTMYLLGATGLDADVRRESVQFITSQWDFTVKLAGHVQRFGWSYDAGEYPELYGRPSKGTVTEITAAELPGLAALEG